jgi:hypothetical protein
MSPTTGSLAFLGIFAGVVTVAFAVYVHVVRRVRRARDTLDDAHFTLYWIDFDRTRKRYLLFWVLCFCVWCNDRV